MGSRIDLKIYVDLKKKACERVGIEYIGFELPDDVTEEELVEKV